MSDREDEGVRSTDVRWECMRELDRRGYRAMLVNDTDFPPVALLVRRDGWPGYLNLLCAFYEPEGFRFANVEHDPWIEDCQSAPIYAWWGLRNVIESMEEGVKGWAERERPLDFNEDRMAELLERWIARQPVTDRTGRASPFVESIRRAVEGVRGKGTGDAN